MKKWISYALFSSVILMAFPCSGKATLTNGDGDEKDKKKKKEEEQSNTEWLFPRSRFFNLTYRSYPTVNDNLISEPPEQDDDDARIFQAKLRFPIVLKSGFNLIGEVGHNRELIYIPQNAGGFGNVRFQRTGIALIGEKKLEKDKFLIGVFSVSNKTEIAASNHSLKPNTISSFLMYGKNLSRFDKIGLGLSVSGNMGRLRVSPVVAYNKQIDHRNFLEIMLPKNITFRHLISNEFYFISSLDAHKSQYALAEERQINNVNSLEVRRTEVSLNAGLEREIHDWLWISADIGLVKPFRNALVARGNPTRAYEGQLYRSFQPQFNVSVYGVIPEKLLKKVKR